MASKEQSRDEVRELTVNWVATAGGHGGRRLAGRPGPTRRPARRAARPDAPAPARTHAPQVDHLAAAQQQLQLAELLTAAMRM
jgi:hypothetical protein